MWNRWRNLKVANAANDEVVEEENGFADVRTATRRAIYREATLFLPEAVRITALAMDISPLGTRIRLARRCRLPDELAVTVLDEVRREPARVVWRDGNDVGLQFINPELDAETYLSTISHSEFDN